MKYFLTTLLLASCTLSVAQSVILSGQINDSKGEPLPYTNVVITGTSSGTSANFSGMYQIELSPNTYSFTYQFIGYKSQTHQINLSNGNVVLDIILEEETLNLREVVVNSNGEDPAYDIIRKAQRKRGQYLRELKEFENKAYTKIFAQAESAGTVINLFGSQLVSDKGIFYLSESFSTIKANNVEDRTETLTASLISGDTAKYSANRAVFINFYDNRALRVNTNEFVSPIASDALNYYDYEFEGYFTENDSIVNKIRLIPKQETFPAFSGHIYIVEDSWRLYGIHAYASAKAADVGDIELKVAYTHVVEDNIWLPFSVDFFLKTFSVEAYYHSIHSDYQFDLTDQEILPNALRYRIADGARNKSEAFWVKNRPIPLSDEETAAYSLNSKDSLEKTKTVSDTTQLVSDPKKKESINVFTLKDYKLKGQWTFTPDPILKSVNFNTVDGVVVQQGVKFTRTGTNEKQFSIKPTLRYGFLSKQFYGKLAIGYDLNLKKPESIQLSGGHFIEQVNGSEPISELLNSLYTLFAGENYLKIYQKDYAQLSYKKELTNGLGLSLSSGYEQRSPLINTSDFSLRKEENTNFTSNNISVNNQSLNFIENQVFKIGAEVNIAFSRPYNELPNKKEILTSRYPEINLAYEGARGDTDFDLFWANVSDNWEVGTLGTSSLSMSYGTFFQNNNLIAPDLFHFSGNQTIAVQESESYGLRYQLLDYYQLSSSDDFFGVNFRHQFQGSIFRKLPLVKKTKMQAFINANYLNTNDTRNYFEAGAGLENILSFFEIGYYQSYLNGSKLNSGVRIGLEINISGS